MSTFEHYPENGYLTYFENETNPDIDGFIKDLVTRIPKFADRTHPDDFTVEVLNLVEMKRRIEKLLSKYPYRIWFIGRSHTRRTKLREKYLNAVAHLDVGLLLLREFRKKEKK